MFHDIEIKAICVSIRFIIELLLGHEKMIIILFFEHSFQHPGILITKYDSVY